MTDYFALLEQPRRAWLDLEKVKESYYAKTRIESPDAGLNEAYQVLRDPKRRLHHLLTIRGQPPTHGTGSVPLEVENLFLPVAGLTREIELLLGKVSQTTNSLSRSLLKGEIAAAQKKISEMLAKLGGLRNAALVRLRSVDENDSAQLQALYLEFSYLNRWMEQLEEKQVQLSF